VPGFEQSFASFPKGVARTWSLGPQPASVSFTWNPHARPKTSFAGNTGAGGLWSATPSYRWLENPPGTSATLGTDPLAENTVVVGAGAVEATIAATVPDVDLQATITEVRPDGHETFVQNGWLRASQRKLDRRKSTRLEPVISRRAADEAPLPKDELVSLTIPLYYEGHVYRAGSRIRVTISAPGGDQPVWSFAELVPKRNTSVSVYTPLTLVLPVVPGVAVPTPLPACSGLRGEACR
jgi:hypothetical protein